MLVFSLIATALDDKSLTLTSDAFNINKGASKFTLYFPTIKNISSSSFAYVIPETGIFGFTNEGVYLVRFTLEPINFISEVTYNIDVMLCVFYGDNTPYGGNRSTIVHQKFNYYNHVDNYIVATDLSGSAVFYTQGKKILQIFLHVEVNQLSDALYFDADDSLMQVRLM